MAPNNALKGKGGNNISNNNSNKSSSVLPQGTVQARGYGTEQPLDQVSQEIQDFLDRPLSLEDEVRSFFTVFTFLTRLPGPIWVDHHPGYLMRGMPTFPLIGTGIACWVAIWFEFVEGALQGLDSCRLLASIVSLAASFWLTGCFHEDGLADSSDGIGGGWSRQQILTIMSDTRLGTYGCAVLILYIVAKVQWVAVLGPVGLFLGHTYARWIPCYMVHTNDYVDDPEGPKTTYYSFMLNAKHLVTSRRVFVATIYTLGIGTLFLESVVKALMLLVGCFVVALAAGRYANYLLGGVMGDYLGASICVGEIFVYTLSWKLLNWSCPVTLLEETNPEIIDLPFLYPFDEHMLQMAKTLPKWIGDGHNKIDFAFMAKQWFETENSMRFLNFIIMIGLVVLWMRNVGPPDVFVREVAIANQDKDTIQIALDESALKEQQRDEKPSNAGDRGSSDKPWLASYQSDATFADIYERVQSYIDGLAKPMRSLGVLEEWAARFATLQVKQSGADASFALYNPIGCAMIFAADHGVAKSPEEGGEGCSAFPQAVTKSIVAGLHRGVAGASVLAKTRGLPLLVVDVGVSGNTDAFDYDSSSVVISGSFRLPNGTKNSCREPAMTLEEMDALLSAGRKALRMHVEKTGASFVCLGEVGIGNTTTSSILLAAILAMDSKVNIDNLIDGGATLGKDVDPNIIAKKKVIVQSALQRFRRNVTKKRQPDIRHILAELGGAELIALAGAILEASENNIAVIVDGFICTVAALAASHLSGTVTKALFLATSSTERGHKLAVEAIQTIATQYKIPAPSDPALSMKLRMGEGTGSLLAAPILTAACSMLTEMATLDEIMQQK